MSVIVHITQFCIWMMLPSSLNRSAPFL